MLIFVACIDVINTLISPIPLLFITEIIIPINVILMMIINIIIMLATDLTSGLLIVYSSHCNMK